jgi:hypothetical protein
VDLLVIIVLVILIEARLLLLLSGLPLRLLALLALLSPFGICLNPS